MGLFTGRRVARTVFWQKTVKNCLTHPLSILGRLLAGTVRGFSGISPYCKPIPITAFHRSVRDIPYTLILPKTHINYSLYAVIFGHVGRVVITFFGLFTPFFG